MPQQPTNRIQDVTADNGIPVGIQILASAPISAVVPASINAPGAAYVSATLPAPAVLEAAVTTAMGTAAGDASSLGNQVTATVTPSILIIGDPTTGTPSPSITGNPVISQVSAAASVPGQATSAAR